MVHLTFERYSFYLFSSGKALTLYYNVIPNHPPLEDRFLVARTHSVQIKWSSPAASQRRAFCKASLLPTAGEYPIEHFKNTRTQPPKRLLRQIRPQHHNENFLNMYTRRTYGLSSYSEKTIKSNHLSTSSQRFSHLKTLSVSPAGVSTRAR